MQNTSEIVDQLRKWDIAYFNDGESSVTDAAYDNLKATLYQLDPTNSYFTVIGAEVISNKVPLPHKMGSLNQIIVGKIKEWIAKYKLQKESIYITNKLDGVSCQLIYRDSKLVQAFSRGDGIEGQDITKHVMLVPSVPKHLNKSVEYLAARAELIMEKNVFNNIYSTQYKNPRNMVAGVFNRKTSDENVLRNINLVIYEIVELKSEEIKWPLSKNLMLSELEYLGFPHIVSSYFTDGDSLTDDFLGNHIKTIKQESPYELDGVVLTVNNWSTLELQSTSQSINPEHSVKYKIVDLSAVQEVEVVRVHWDISKWGLFKPRVEIKPVNIGGVTVTFATGFNGAFIRNSNIGPGAIVQITRSGDVIPYIMSVVKPAKPDLPVGDWTWTINKDGEEVDIVLKDLNHANVTFKQVLDFFTSLDVEQFKEASLREIFDKYDLADKKYTEILETIFDLTDSELVKIIGANGKKIYVSLHRRLENLTMPLLLGSLNYFGSGFGVRKAKTLLEQVTYEQLREMPVDAIAELKGFDTTTATNIVKGITQVDYFLRQCKDYLVFKKEELKSTELATLNIVMTGFRDKDLHAKVEALGGKVASGVSSKTTHLLAIDITDNSGKLKKARELGITILTPDQFKDLFNL